MPFSQKIRSGHRRALFRAGADDLTDLAVKEYDLLRLFLENPGQVFTRDRLLSAVWGADYYGETRTVDVHIGTLRTKLGTAGDILQTVRGVGYKLEAPHE